MIAASGPPPGRLPDQLSCPMALILPSLAAPIRMRWIVAERCTVLLAIMARGSATFTGRNPATANSFQAGLLADNGGPVQTIAITPVGVAHDAGDSGALPADTADLDGNGITTGETIPVDARG